MAEDNRTWLERQEEQQRCLSDCTEQAAEMHDRFNKCLEGIDKVESDIRQQIEQTNNRFFRWIFNRQLKKVLRNRQQQLELMSRMGKLDESILELRKELKKPPQIPIRHTRIVSIPVDILLLFIILLAITLVGVQFLSKH